MPKPYTPTEQNTPGRLNRWVRAGLLWGISMGTAFLPVTTVEHAVLYAGASLSLTNAAERLWTRFGAPLVTNLTDEAYQGLYITPDESGEALVYLVSKPRHRWDKGEARGRRDVTDPDVVFPVGRYATRPLAEAACSTVNSERPTFLDAVARASNGDWDRIARATLAVSERRADAFPTIREVPLTRWRITTLGTHPPQQNLYVAYRQILGEDNNPRYEFFPQPPGTRDTGRELMQDLRSWWVSLSPLDHSVPNAPQENVPILPEWRRQAFAARGLATMETSITEPISATEGRDFWQLERSPQMRWRAVHVQTQADGRITRRVLTLPEAPDVVWETADPQVLRDLLASQQIVVVATQRLSAETTAAIEPPLLRLLRATEITRHRGRRL